MKYCHYCNQGIFIEEKEYQCKICNEYICLDCVEYCSDCRRTLCPDCAEDNTCAECNDTLCPNCTHKCNNCNNLVCTDCYVHCDSCNKQICLSCVISCDQCDNNACSHCTTDCSLCNNVICNNCTIECIGCNSIVCTDCRYTCDSCNEHICSDCINYCEQCVLTYCQHCFENDHACIFDMDGYLYNPTILDYSTKPEWSFTKQPWENTTYLGLELEIELGNNVTEQDCLDIAQNHFDCEYIWKSDSSLNNGMEFVFSPHTLQSIKKRDFRSFLSKLQKTGARSWDPGTCGIHIHVGWDTFKKRDIDKLEAFFLANKSKIIKFSGRSEKNFNRWCAITEKPGGRNVALNRNPETLEFRIFRGTLNYERFRSNLIFVEAVIDFVQNHSLAFCQKSDSFQGFLDFIKTKYQHLYNFMEQKGICA